MYGDSDYYENLSDSEWLQEALFEYAKEHGEFRKDEQWISTPYDTWERNPHYVGPEQPHPELLQNL